MKKYVFALAALALTLVACEKKEEVKDTTPAQLVSFQLLKADNAFLDADYAPASISESMLIRVPGGGMDKTFTATITVGEFDKLSVNGKAVEGTKAQFEGKYAVDIEVVNSKSGKSAAYEVKIGKILQIVNKEVATFKAAGEKPQYTAGNYAAGTNPVTGDVYIAYVYGSTKNIGVVKFDGTTVSQVGVEGIASGKVGVSKVCRVAFDSKGTPYVLYIGGEVSSRISLRKYDGADWVLVAEGVGNSSPNTSYLPNVYFDASDAPGIIYTGNTKANTDAYRNGVVVTNNGTEWTEGSISNLPRYDSGTNANVFYGSAFVYSGDKAYGFFTGNNMGIYVYELAGSSWATPLVSAFIPEGETTSLPGNLTPCVKADGTILMFAAHWTAAVMQGYKLNGTTFEKYGNTIPVAIKSNGAVDEEILFGVNPKTDEVIAVKTDGSSKQISYTLLDENFQWSEFAFLGEVVKTPSEENPEETITSYSAPASRSGAMLGFDAKGNAIVVYPDKDETTGFHIYSIGLEEDILPE